MRIMVAGSVFSRLASARTLSRTNPRGCSKAGRIISCRLELNNPSRAAKFNGAVERDVACRRSGISRMKHVGDRSLCQYADEASLMFSLLTMRPEPLDAESSELPRSDTRH